MEQGAILVLSGPSGAGKSTIIQASSKEIGEYYFSISTTTRQPRVGEREGIDYFFVSLEVFKADIKAGNFLEYAKVHNNYYGTSLKAVKIALSEGKLVIFDIDVQGHRLVREKMNAITTSVFMNPPSLKVLEQRLRARSTDDESIILNRLRTAKNEIKALGEYDYSIINDTIKKASKSFILIAKVARLKQSEEDEANFVLQWLGEK